MTGGRTPASTPAFRAMGNAPMLLACCAFSAGILWPRDSYSPPSWIVAGILILVIAASPLLCLRYWRAAALAAAGAFFFLGGLAWLGHCSVPRATRLRDYATREEIELIGVARSDGASAPAMYGGTKQTLDLEVESITMESTPERIPGGARISLYADSSSDQDDDAGATRPIVPHLISAGQRIRLRAKLGVPSNYLNPGAFDYTHYLERQGILVTGSGKLSSVEVLGEGLSTPWERARRAAQRNIRGRIHSIWAADKASVLDAMLLGDASSIGRDVRTDFQRSGTYHILVVSGFNVGILAMVVFWFLRRLPTGETVATILTLILAFAYTYLTGAGAPVIRATVMLGIYLVTRLLYRDRAALNAVSAAALGLLLYDPESLFDPSFQLTFLSVLAIAGIVVPLLEVSSSPYHRALSQLSVIGIDSSLPPKQAQFRLDLRLLGARLGRLLGQRPAYGMVRGAAGLILALYETLLVSAVMQVALALPMAWYFHRTTITALPANTLVVPLTAWMLPTAIATICLDLLWTRLALPAKLLTDGMLAFISGTVRLFGGMRVSDVRVCTPGLLAAFAALAAVALAILLLRRQRALFRFGAILALLITSLWVFLGRQLSHTAPGHLQIVSIDVGQGDSSLVITPDGLTLLIDSGGTLNGEHSNFDVGEDVVSPTLWNLGIDRLDAVAVSHTHADHAAGMNAVIHNFRPREIWLAPGAPSRERQRLLESAARDNVKLVERTAGQQFSFGGASVQVLAPPRDLDFGQKVKDDDSMALRISYQNRSALFVGDMGKHGEDRLYAGNPSADLLKVAHHGSANATSPEFLAAVHPAYAIVSAGRHNAFGHPRIQTLEKLASGHVRTYRTDLFGATRFDLDASGVRVKSLAPLALQ